MAQILNVLKYKIKSFFKKSKDDSKMTDYENMTREEWWIKRFPEQRIIYNAQDSKPRDVRNFIFPKSYILDDIIKKYNLVGGNDNDTMWKCCVFVQEHIKYVGDQESRKQLEFWQYPEDTLTRGIGDCEDGAILMKSLALCAGVPDWKVKVVAGNVKGGGHAYCTFIRDDDVQVIMDWCIVDSSKTKVNMTKGHAKRFIDLKVGDEVIGYNESTGGLEPTTIISIGNRVTSDIYIE